jgi:hypothetical protein
MAEDALSRVTAPEGYPETPDGHAIHYDESGAVIGLTLLNGATRSSARAGPRRSAFRSVRAPYMCARPTPEAS